MPSKLILCLAVAVPSCYGVARVNPYNYHSLSVEGRGFVDIVTDQLLVQMTINSQNNCQGLTEDDPACDASAVQQRTSQLTQQLVNKMASHDGVISFSAGSLSLTPVNQFNQTLQTDEFMGFQSSIKLTAIINGEIAGDFIDESVSMGVNQIDGISYFVSDAVIKKTQQEALELATEDAMLQAKTVLDVFNSTVKQVKSVTVPFIQRPFKDNGPAELEDTQQGKKSSSAIRTVGYGVKLLLKYS